MPRSVASAISSEVRRASAGARDTRLNARSVKLRHSRGTQLRERRFRGLGVVAQCIDRRAAEVEVRRELRGRDGPIFGALAFEHRADLAMQIGACGRSHSIVEHLPEERMAERIAFIVLIGVA